MIKPANAWHQGIQYCQQHGLGYVLVTVVGALGSTPRAVGTKMVVTQDRQFDTVGGGNLEFDAIRKARELLARGESQQHIEHYPLAAKLAQCCGGNAHVMFEVLNINVSKLALFGAGHVAGALIPIINQLPVQIHWIDNRHGQFLTHDALNTDSLHLHTLEEPCEIFSMEENITHVLVMTHDHQLDFDITKSAIALDSTQYVGVIGSQTKAKRFKHRLKQSFGASHGIDKFVSPIGLPQVTGKRPIEVAVSVAAQLIQLFNQTQSTHDKSRERTTWQQTKQLMEDL